MASMNASLNSLKVLGASQDQNKLFQWQCQNFLYEANLDQPFSNTDYYLIGTFWNHMIFPCIWHTRPPLATLWHEWWIWGPFEEHSSSASRSAALSSESSDSWAPQSAAEASAPSGWSPLILWTCRTPPVVVAEAVANNIKLTYSTIGKLNIGPYNPI
jgi:hypothetical protein